MYFVKCLSFVRSASSSGLKNLRLKTGFPLHSCKKALDSFGGNSQQAEKWLYEQAQAEGWKKANSVIGRNMRRGLVGLKTSDDQRFALFAELSCETDFVVRNTEFHSLVCKCLVSIEKAFSNIHTLSQVMTAEKMSNIRSIFGQNRSLADELALCIGNVGENMSLVRTVLFALPPPPQFDELGGKSQKYHLASYVHSNLETSSLLEGCQVGRCAGAYSFTQLNDDLAPPSRVTDAIARHIVGSSPLSLGQEDFDLYVEEETRKLETVVEENVDDDSMRVSDIEDDVLRPNDLDVKNQDNDVDVGSQSEDEESFVKPESRLLLQTLYNGSMKVGDLCLENGISINNFIRIECGKDVLHGRPAVE